MDKKNDNTDLPKDEEQKTVEGENKHEPGPGEGPAMDEIADKGEPRPFEEGWKDQQKYGAD